jgi:transposase
VLFIGDDWAEAHHDIEIEDDTGKVLVRKRLTEGLAGITGVHELVAEHLDPTGEPDQVLVGIETERGPWVQALLAAGYVVYPINPMQVARYRERHSTSGAKSDAADAHLLAEIVRLDRAHHRPVAGDTEIAEHLKVATRAHQTMIWSRVRQVNALRSLLREYYPAALAAFGSDLADRDALAVLAIAPTPEQGRRLSQARIESVLRRAGRQRNLAATAAKIRAVLGSEQLTARPGVIPAYAASASALIAVLTVMASQVEVLAGQVEQGAGRVRRRSRPLRRRQSAEELLRHVPDHQGLRHQTGRPGPLRPQPPTRRRVVPSGLLRPTILTRSPSVLRSSPRPRRHPLPSPPRPSQPPGRHSPRLPTTPHPLRRAPSLAHRRRDDPHRCLTTCRRGISS